MPASSSHAAPPRPRATTHAAGEHTDARAGSGEERRIPSPRGARLVAGAGRATSGRRQPRALMSGERGGEGLGGRGPGGSAGGGRFPGAVLVLVDSSSGHAERVEDGQKFQEQAEDRMHSMLSWMADVDNNDAVPGRNRRMRRALPLVDAVAPATARALQGQEPLAAAGSTAAESRALPVDDAQAEDRTRGHDERMCFDPRGATALGAKSARNCAFPGSSREALRPGRERSVRSGFRSDLRAAGTRRLAQHAGYSVQPTYAPGHSANGPPGGPAAKIVRSP